MHSRNSYSALFSPRSRPRVLKIPYRTISTSDASKDEHTPYFKSSGPSLLPAASCVNLRPEGLKIPKLLPPLQPLLHVPKTSAGFTFRALKRKESFTVTFRMTKNK